jgi:hypothetical protein
MEDNGLSTSLLSSGEYRALVLGELTQIFLKFGIPFGLSF